MDSGRWRPSSEWTPERSAALSRSAAVLLVGGISLGWFAATKDPYYIMACAAAALVALVVAQLLYSVVNLQLLEPDNPNDARGARAVLDLRWGVVVTDVACRADATGAWKGDAARLEAVWNCAKPFGDGP